MKAKHVFLTLGLSLAMGLGVAAAFTGVKKVEQVKAETAVTVYCAISSSKMDGKTLKVNAKLQGDSDNWSQSNMTFANSYYNKMPVYSGNFTAPYDGAAIIQFQIYDGSDWKEQDEVFSTWNSAGVFNNKLWVYDAEVGTNWVSFSPKNVDVYVGGVKRATEGICEGQLPYTPDYDYGKKFDGWYTNPDYTGKVDGITSTTDELYGRILDDASHGYVFSSSDTIKASAFYGDGSRKVYLYEFNEHGHSNAAWPGEYLFTTYTGGFFSLYENSKFVIVSEAADDATDRLQTVDAKAPTNYVYDDVVVVLDDTDNGKYKVAWESELPDEEGYYLQSSEIGWNFTDNPPQFDYNGGAALDDKGNIAILENQTVIAGEEVKVHSYFNSIGWVNITDQAATLHYDDFGTTSDVSAPGNFKFTTAGSYDFYVKDGAFFISQHINRHTVTAYALKYEGRTFIEKVSAGTQQVEEGNSVVLADPSIPGFVRITGAYTDEEMNNAFTGVVNADMDVYYRFEKSGCYLMGDSVFAAGTGTAWDISSAIRMRGTGEVSDPQNAYEIVATIPSPADETNPVSVKPYIVDSDYWVSNCALGVDSTKDVSEFVRIHHSEDSSNGNIEFIKPGTYVVYVKMESDIPTLYFNVSGTGVDTFVANFLSAVGTACTAVQTDAANITQLHTAWSNMETAWNALGGVEKAVIKAVGFNGGSESDDLHKMVAKYNRVVTKYGTDEFTDFIWEGTVPSNRVGNSINTNNVALIVTLVSVTTIVASAALVMFLLKKKKYSK